MGTGAVWVKRGGAAGVVSRETGPSAKNRGVREAVPGGTPEEEKLYSKAPDHITGGKVVTFYLSYHTFLFFA